MVDEIIVVKEKIEKEDFGKCKIDDVLIQKKN